MSSCLVFGTTDSTDRKPESRLRTETITAVAGDARSIGNQKQGPVSNIYSEALTPYRAEYSATYNGLPLNAVRTLTKTDEGFRISVKATSFLGSVSEDETFSSSPMGALQPAKYLYTRSVLGKVRTEETLFNPDIRQITNTYKGTAVTLPYTSDLLGPLSYQVRLQIDLSKGLRKFNYPVVTRGKQKNYRFEIVGREELKTPLGAMNTVLLKMQRESNKRRTFIWLASRLHFLPVKFLQQEDNESYEMLIKSYTSTDS